MISAFIVDDKPANIQTLRKMISTYCPQVKVAGTAINIDSAYTGITASVPDLVFLDIEMPGGNGFDLLRKFTQIDFEVVFITAYNQYAVRAFREHALDYLLKPVDIDSLQEAVARAEQQWGLMENRQKLEKYLQQSPATGKISIPVRDGYLFINSDEIVRCEGAGSYSFFYMADGKKQIVSMRLKECEELLPATWFFRVHNSHIINLKYVARYVRGRGGNIQMLDGSTVDVAVSRKESFLEMMKRHS